MDPALTDACRRFEAVMLQPLLDSLKLGRLAPLEDDRDDGAEPPDAAAGIMQSMFSDAFALALARAGGLGVAEQLARALSDRRR